MIHYRVYDDKKVSNQSFVVSVDNKQEALELAMFWARNNSKEYFVGNDFGFWAIAIPTKGVMVVME